MKGWRRSAQRLFGTPVSEEQHAVEPAIPAPPPKPPVLPTPPQEIGGPSGPEPTRYGDWERKGRCIDF
jgi:hypothetical protein